MKCEEAMERINDRLTGDLDAATLAALRDHLAGCAGCAAEARAMQSLWDALGDADSETPSAALRRRFERMLRREIATGEIASRESAAPPFESQESATLSNADLTDELARRRALPAPPPGMGQRRRERTVYRGVLGLALAAALTIALGAGVFIGSSTASKRSAEDMTALRDEIRSLRSTVALALLSEPSASERLDGVAYGRSLQTEDHRVADALFSTLLEDSNVNVRLAALDALREVSARPDVRARLVQSIPEQDSPLVQISAIDVLLESGATAASTQDLAGLAQDPALDEVVRGYLRDRLERSPR
jgi:hypothetical protein